MSAKGQTAATAATMIRDSDVEVMAPNRGAASENGNAFLPSLRKRNSLFWRRDRRQTLLLFAMMMAGALPEIAGLAAEPAHRRSAVQGCDMLYDLKDGRAEGVRNYQRLRNGHHVWRELAA